MPLLNSNTEVPLINREFLQYAIGLSIAGLTIMGILVIVLLGGTWLENYLRKYNK